MVKGHPSVTDHHIRNWARAKGVAFDDLKPYIRFRQMFEHYKQLPPLLLVENSPLPNRI